MSQRIQETSLQSPVKEPSTRSSAGALAAPEVVAVKGLKFKLDMGKKRRLLDLRVQTTPLASSPGSAGLPVPLVRTEEGRLAEPSKSALLPPAQHLRVLRAVRQPPLREELEKRRSLGSLVKNVALEGRQAGVRPGLRADLGAALASDSTSRTPSSPSRDAGRKPTAGSAPSQPWEPTLTRKYLVESGNWSWTVKGAFRSSRRPGSQRWQQRPRQHLQLLLPLFPLRPAPPRAPGPRAPTPPLRLPGASGAPAARLTLKFLAVLLAAGMLAFLGAVICIIASVPLAASRARALPGGADNASAASGAAAASPGPQRSLSALHGAGSSAGPPALPGAPAASAHPLPPVPLFSRFLCTPLAAACPSGGEQGDAALGEREELLLLQSTADQLRQTALQQEARIRADQDTIRELTGKLGRCESGLPRGLQDAGPRRDTMADGPWESPALIVELEDAVRALRDRIDRIEQELPARVNFSAAPAPAPTVPTALHSKMDELEGQLLAKVLALEKERVALSHSNHRQRQEVEKELDALHDRVAELEHGSSAYSPPDAFKISIPIRNNYMYARVRKALPELYAFTVCVWLRSRSGGTGQGTPFSYSVPGQANEIVLLEAGHDPMELLINDKVAQLPLSLKDNGWHHICIAWTTRDGLWSAYQDGELRGSGENLAAWHPIKPHGILILGQEQDTLGGRFDATQAFVGDIAQFNLWDHALTPAQVLGIANCTAPLLGNVLPWGDKLVEAFGGATKAAFDVCKGRAKA
ncbi:neuronal pentraxin receptor [Phyllostomus hastatus]|uniref:neuronal pentraxin receptor n=1 Tax=Phyllostomus hastatus TaxID=9423 RepID=UPI001E67EC85|nr:neuronal pentraxin receptor [Phyllostomus hastatus]